jgi:hypothetical protein
MRDIIERRLTQDEFAVLRKNRHLPITCDCGNALLVWENRNKCACHRARCLRCRNSRSYIVKIFKRKYGDVAKLLTINDSYEEWEQALMSGDCAISQSVYVEEETNLR